MRSAKDDREAGKRFLQRARQLKRRNQLRGHQAQAHEIGGALKYPPRHLIDGEPFDVRVYGGDLDAVGAQQGRDVEDTERLKTVLRLLAGQERWITERDSHGERRRELSIIGN